VTSESIFHFHGKLSQIMRPDDTTEVTDLSTDLPLNYNLNSTFLKVIVLLKSSSCNVISMSVFIVMKKKVIRNIKIQQTAQIFTIYQLLAQQLLLPISQPKFFSCYYQITISCYECQFFRVCWILHSICYNQSVLTFNCLICYNITDTFTISSARLSVFVPSLYFFQMRCRLRQNILYSVFFAKEFTLLWHS